MSLDEMLKEKEKIQADLEQKAEVISTQINKLNQQLANINKEYLENKGQIDLLKDLIKKPKEEIQDYDKSQTE